MKHEKAALLALVSISCTVAAQRPDFTGIWNSSSAIPLERPAKFKNKAVLTREEAAELERQTGGEESLPRPGTNSVGTYNVAWREFGAHGKNLRTSIITDPADGRLPALTPPAAAEKDRRMKLLRDPARARDMGLQDRCLMFVTSGPPMLPYSYNSNYQILQTGNDLMINVEMAHDTRVVHMDGRGHLPGSIRMWLGDSIGRWDGSTLVIDTANFNNGGGFFGDAGGMFGSDGNLHVIERLSLPDPNTIFYQFEVRDPTAFTRSWKGELTMNRATGPVYEYACHEGNYAMPNLLKNFRLADR